MPLWRIFGSKFPILAKIATLLNNTLVKNGFFFQFGKSDGFMVSRRSFRIKSLP